MMTMQNIRTNISALVLTIIFAGCATTPVVSQRDSGSVSGVTRIVIAPPIVEHIDAATGNILPQDENIIAELRSALSTKVRSELSDKQIATLDLSEIPDADLAALSEDLGHTYRTIKRHSTELDAPQEDQLSWIAATAHASHLLFCRCRLYAGPGGFWDPMSGAIASGSSRIVFESHLYNILDKKVVWTQSAQTRASPDTGISNISTIVPLVFNTLESK
jgi:hypothetical protein